MNTDFSKVNTMVNLAFLIFFLSLSPSGGAQLKLKGRNVKCSDPGTPDHAMREDELTSFRPGEEVIFSCEFTYRLIGSQRRTCLQNGTWSGVQPKCELYMCDELDVWEPDNGQRFGNVFTIGSNLTFGCLPNYKLKGDGVVQCLPNGQWSANAPVCEHLCKVVKCGKGEMCQARNGKTRCSCRSNMDCSSLVDRVCGSDGVTYINECIMNATACRNKKDIRRLQAGHCVPGEVCSIVPTSVCRGFFQVYFYNVSKGRCEQIVAGGCHPSGWNGFTSSKECQDYCDKDACVMKPDHGPCSEKQNRWYYDSSTTNCRKFKYGGCFGNANNFRTKHDCKKRCPMKNKKPNIAN